MKQGWWMAIAAMALAQALAIGSALAAIAPKVTSVDFKVNGDSSLIEIRTTAPVTFEKTENTSDKQLVIDLKGARLSATAGRSLDTSSFSGLVSLVSPYEVSSGVRLVVQLRGMAATDVTQDGNLIRVKIPNQAVTADVAPAGNSVQPVDQPTDRMEEFFKSRATQHFIGKPVTLQLRDADISDVFRLVADASGFNIVMSDDVKGKVTLSLTDVPWDQALDVVLQIEHLGAERNNNVLRITTLKNLTVEKQEELAAKEAADATAPRIMKVFQISYAKLSDLKTILTQLVSAGNNALPGVTQGGGQALGAGVSMNTGTKIEVDERTNSLIVWDIPEHIARIQKLIEILDTATPQVMIEGKIVLIKETYANGVSGNLGIGGNPASNQQFLTSFNGADVLDQLLGGTSPIVTGSGFAANAGNPTGNNQFGISPTLSILPGVSRINAILSMGENEEKLRILSAPKLVVLNKQKANILQSEPVVFNSPQIIGIGTQTQTIPQINMANISLDVEPTVTMDGSVLMNLKVSRDVPVNLPGGAGAAVGNRNITTDVLVKSGNTLVLGGIYDDTKDVSSSGFPFLRKIPIIGWLFGTESDNTQRNELFIFITPRILNSKEAGISA